MVAQAIRRESQPSATKKLRVDIGDQLDSISLSDSDAKGVRRAQVERLKFEQTQLPEVQVIPVPEDSFSIEIEKQQSSATVTTGDPESIAQEKSTSQTTRKDELSGEQTRMHDLLKRVLRRVIIGEEMQRNEGQSSTIDAARERWSGQHVDEASLALVQERWPVPSELRAISQELYEKMHAQFPQVKAVVLMGGAVSGGAMIRGLLGRQLITDLDWGVIYDDPKSPRLSWFLQGDHACHERDFSEQILKNVLHAHGISGVGSCFLYNPRLYYACSPSCEDLDELLVDIEYGEDVIPDTVNRKAILRFYFFLSPTFPDTVGKEHEKTLRAWFLNLSKDDQNKFLSRIKILFEKHIFRFDEGAISAKYFRRLREIKFDPEIEKLVREIRELSRKLHPVLSFFSSLVKEKKPDS